MSSLYRPDMSSTSKAEMSTTLQGNDTFPGMTFVFRLPFFFPSLPSLPALPASVFFFFAFPERSSLSISSCCRSTPIIPAADGCLAVNVVSVQ